MFMGSRRNSRGKVTLTNQNVSDTSAGAASAAYQVRADGTVWEDTLSGGAAQLSSATDWIIPNSKANSSYEVRMTQNSGDTLTSGTLNTWLALSVDRTWSYSNTFSLSGNFTVEIRYNGGSVIDSATIDISTTVL